MSETYSAALYRQEGAGFRSFRLSVRADGSVNRKAQDIGELVQKIWGDDDYELPRISRQSPSGLAQAARRSRVRPSDRGG